MAPGEAYWGVIDCGVVGRSVIKFTKYSKYNVQSVLVFSQVEIVRWHVARKNNVTSTVQETAQSPPVELILVEGSASTDDVVCNASEIAVISIVLGATVSCNVRVMQRRASNIAMTRVRAIKKYIDNVE